MGSIVKDQVEEYVEGLTAPRDELLLRLEAEAAAEDIPIVGPEEGSLLQILAGLQRPRAILELGTAIGYSTTWLARGAPEARVVTVEGDRERAARARTNLKEAGLAARVEVKEGDAINVAAGLEAPYELIFNDIDKVGYPRVLRDLKRLLPPGGLLVTDNVLWSGKVASPRWSDPSTAAIRTYNEMLALDPDMLTVIVPLRDGVSLSWKRRR